MPCDALAIFDERTQTVEASSRRFQTPLGTLLSRENPEPHLRAGVTLADLQQQALRQSETEAARPIQTVKQKPFADFRRTA